MNETIESKQYPALFKIKGASHNKEKEIIFLCRWYGEPFWVEPTCFDSKTRKKMWVACDTYFNKWLLIEAAMYTKRGIPIEPVRVIAMCDYKKEAELLKDNLYGTN